MRKTFARILFALVLAAALSTAVCGQTRTTPVEVENSPTVKIDKMDNYVKIDQSESALKAEQYGTWNVGITGTPTVGISGIPKVSVDDMPTVNVYTHPVTQSGAWNVGISGTPTVNANTHPVTQGGEWNVGIAGTPTMRIDATENLVQSKAVYSKVWLFPNENPVVGSGATAYSAEIDCRGFKEMRVILNYGPSLSANNRLYVYFRGPNSTNYTEAGYFPGDTKQVVDSPNFVYSTTSSAGLPVSFSVPVLSDYMRIGVYNGAGGSITVWGGYGLAYLVP